MTSDQLRRAVLAFTVGEAVQQQHPATSRDGSVTVATSRGARASPCTGEVSRSSSSTASGLPYHPAASAVRAAGTLASNRLACGDGVVAGDHGEH